MIKIEKLQNELLRKIGLLSRSVQSSSEINHKKLKLQKGQFIFLTRVCENKGITFTRLSEILKIDKTTVTKAIQKLITLKYIEKKQDYTDRRSYRLYPTDLGLEIYDRVIAEENRTLEIILSDISEDYRENFEKIIEKMIENITKS